MDDETEPSEEDLTAIKTDWAEDTEI